MSPICGELKLKHDFVCNCTEACSFGALGTSFDAAFTPFLERFGPF